jgi:tetratricopeptide (TPR) repeat protein
MLRRSVLFAILATMLSAAPVLAQSGNRDAARRHYQEGQRLFQAGQYEQALAQFQSAYRNEPHPVSLKSQAECLVRLNNIPEAIRLFQQYVDWNPAPSDAEDVRRRIAELQNRPGRLYIVSNPPGAAITLDRSRLPDRTPANVEVAAGAHTIAVEMEGYQAVLQNVTVTGGASQTVQLALVPVGAPPPVYATPSPTPTPVIPGTPPVQEQGARITTPVWVMIGVTGAALLTGIVCGGLALSDQGEFDDGIDNGMSRLELEDLADAGETKALVADISFGLAAAAAITGIVLFFVDYAHRRRSSSQPGYSLNLGLTPTASDSGGGFSLFGRF